MNKFVIDANLPYYFSLWKGDEYIHLKELNEEWTDEQVWNYAKTNNLTIVTKDSDFSNRILLSEPPPRIIHIKIGNLKLKFLYNVLSGLWVEVRLLSDKYKLVNVFNDRIEGIK